MTATVTPPVPSTPGKKMIDLTIDDKPVSVPEGTTIWEAAQLLGMTITDIPILCHKPQEKDLNRDVKGMNPVGVCRVCAVDIGGGRFPAACVRPCDPGMKVKTMGEKLEAARKTIVELLVSDHPVPCARHKSEAHDCELELMAERMGILKPIATPTARRAAATPAPGSAELPIPATQPKPFSHFTPRAYSKGTDFTNPTIAIDHSACILCDRCVRACTDVVGNDVIGRMGKGYSATISFDNNKPMGDSSCVSCGECMISCPTGAITWSGGVQTKMEHGAPLRVEDLKQVDIFSGISGNYLKRSEGAVVVRKFKKGDIICKQGDFGSTAFYITSGKVDIYIETDLSHVRTKNEGGLFKRVTSLLKPRGTDSRVAEGDKRFIPIDANVDLSYDKPIAQVGEMELIGEAACMNYQPRSATVRAATDEVECLEMLRNVLDILRRNRKFKANMEAKYRERALENHLRSVPVFRDLPHEFIEKLKAKVQLITFAPDEVICRQGDLADAFYLIRMGHVKVFESYADGQNLVLSYLSRSQYFGEIGLLGGGGLRTANCSALDHVEVVRIDKAEFDEMMQQFPQIREQLQSVADSRLESNEKRNSMLRTLTLPQYIEQGLYEAQSLLILDLEKCTRCDECVRACAQAHNGITRLIRDGIRYDKYLVTTACRSCRDPYCMVGCPVGSIRRKDDLEIIIEDHCIGCGRCAEQCPYGNINMHPFEMTFKDPSTGEKKKEVRRKAAVCDLCTDQCLDEDEDPSCVYACPHDAAHRVNGQTFFDRELQGTGAKNGKSQA